MPRDIQKINLDKYSGDLQELKKQIEDALSNGYTKYEFWYDTGYYNDVADVWIEAHK